MGSPASSNDDLQGRLCNLENVGGYKLEFLQAQFFFLNFLLLTIAGTGTCYFFLAQCRLVNISNIFVLSGAGRRPYGRSGTK